jgi:DNA-binding GntR family transcriptional regulator
LQDWPAWGFLNQAFHHTICVYSSNGRLVDEIDRLFMQVERAKLVIPERTLDIAASQHEHKALVAALRRHDVDEACAVAEHRGERNVRAPYGSTEVRRAERCGGPLMSGVVRTS